MALINYEIRACTVRDTRIRHKCLEAEHTLKYEPLKQLHHCTHCLNQEDI